MLDFIRKNAQSVFFQIIVVFIILAFVFWGGSSMLTSRQSAITVNKEEITFQEFDKAYKSTYARIADQFGGEIPKALLDSLDVKGQVIQRLVREALLRQGADDMGVIVSANEIQREIDSMKEFQENGVFDLQKYKTLLSRNGFSPAKFEKSMKRGLLAEKTTADIGSFVNTVTDYEINNLFVIENETVSVDYIKISPADFTTAVNPTDEELKVWYDLHKNNYKTAPQYKLNYLDFSYDNISKKITVEPSEIKAYYQKNIDAYKTPETRHARHILFRAKAEDSEELHKSKKQLAEDTLKKLKDGADFAEVAKEVSEGPTAPGGGDLGFFSKGQMVPEFETATFSLNKGQISDVVQTPFGYHIIKLEEINNATTQPLEQVEKDIAETLKLNLAKTMAFKMANEAYEGIIAAGSLANFIAANKEYQVIKTDFFAKDQAPASLQGQQQFLDKAFALNKKELSSLVETDKGYAIIFAEDIKEPEVPPFADVSQQISQNYAAEHAKTMAKEKADELVAKLAEDPKLENAVAGTTYTVINSGPFTKSRPNQTRSFPVSLTSQAFRLSPSAPYSKTPALVGEDYFIFALDERKVPERQMTETERERYKETLKQLKQQQLLAAWIKNQEEDSKVTIHRSLK